jgi:NAD(P)-dependent dehydrogenase (short-subunit alcohol dehydrogenase family)
VKLTGKVCVVTGGARGIGRAIVEELARDGARPVILDVDGDAAEDYAADLRARAIDARALTCDVSSRASVVAAAETVARETGRCDVLVNNAGIAVIGPSLEVREDDWRRSLDVMTTGVFFCCQAFGRQLVDGGGAIVNIASINARVAFPGRLAYNAAKAAVVQMTEVLAIEWAEHDVRVNAVAPGVIRTELVARAIEEGVADEAMYVGRTPLRRLGRPEEVAKAVLFLASDDDSGFVTGHTLVVDGGWSAYGWV